MRHLILFLLPLYSSILTAQDLNFAVSAIPEKLVKNANAVVRLNHLDVELHSLTEMEISMRRVVTVLNKLGDTHVNGQVGYNNSIKIKDVQAIVYDKNGSEIKKFKERDFNDISAVDGGTLYSDSRVKYLKYTPIDYPYTVEFTYNLSTKNTAITPSWYFLEGFMVSTEKSVYNISWKIPEMKPQILTLHLDGYSINTIENENRTTFIGSEIPSMKSEAHAPAFSKIAPKIMVRPTTFNYEGFLGKVENWKDLGLWMYSNMLENRNEVSDKTKDDVLALTEGITDPMAKAKKIYQYVQDNMRYISVQVGIGGIQPISAIEVDKVKYGDCKGLSNFTKALLALVGVEAYYVHVEAGNTKIDFFEDFADLSQGNHVILAIPEGENYHWIDCTSKTHPFGFLGDFTDDRTVMVIKPNGGELRRTPSYLNEFNRQNITASISISADLSLKAQVKIKTKGTQYDSHFFLVNENKDDVIKYYKKFWSNVNNLQIIGFQFQNNKEDVEFVEDIDLEASNYAVKSGNRLFLSPNVLNRNAYIPKRYRNRSLPFEISRGYLDEDKYVIVLPAGYAIEAIPRAVSIENEFGTYHLKFDLDNKSNTLTYSRSLLLKTNLFPKDKYEDYRNFRKEVAKYDNAQMVLKQL
ncbi:DUF3857 domain-containing transglutaminase family protein [Muriicola sp. E247]|uniref:DUF3857 domain-containing transglutaminase family protein n=1 Tax=Muriicola sp. E247 TaxID=3242730 RepID=UPI0035239ADA